MNLDILSDWGMKVLTYLKLKETKERAYFELLWVKGYKKLIKELAEVNHVLSEIKTLLKTKGMSLQNVKRSKKILNSIKTCNQRTERLKTYVAVFLDEQRALLPTKKNIVCTSDIIESAFGKYKNYISNNPMVGITSLALSMAAFTCKLSRDEVLNAMENIKVKDIKSWSDRYIGETNLQRRMRVLRKAG